MKNKTECFSNTKIFTNFKVGTIYVYVIKLYSKNLKYSNIFSIFASKSKFDTIY